MRHFDEVMGNVATFLPAELLEELNTLMEDEFDKHYQAGYSDGECSGSSDYDKGYSEGYSDGYDAGQAEATN